MMSFAHDITTNASDLLIDIGANLTHESFVHDLDEVIARAAAVGVTRQVVTGADLASSTQAAALATAHRGVLWCTAGVHPHHAVRFDPEVRLALLELLHRPEVVAVGECGLDYYRNLSPPEVQRRTFSEQLKMAASVGKPVFLHQRDAHADFTALLREYRPSLKGGIAHCFTGSRKEMEDYLDLNLSIGVTGWVCDERRGQDLRAAVPHIPLQRLMLETDAPYLLPRDMRPAPRSRRNEPAYLPHIAHAVAALRTATHPTESLQALLAAATQNAEAFFELNATGL